MNMELGHGPYQDGKNWLDWGRDADDYFAHGNYERALECYDIAIQLGWHEPGTAMRDVEICFQRAKCLFYLGRFQQALLSIDAVIEEYEYISVSGMCKELLDEAKEYRKRILENMKRSGNGL